MKLQIAVEGKTYEVEVEVLEEDAGPLPAGYDSYPPVVAALQSMPLPGSQAEDDWGDGGGERVCRSPITGLVIRVNVAPGQSVQTNDLIMVLEAMKMETNVTAPGAGRVKRVNVAAGESVKVNQVIVEFE